MTTPRPRRHDMIVTRWGARFMGRRFPCAIGRGGLTDEKREGDGATPLGIWTLPSGMYRPDRGASPKTSIPMREIWPRHLWSDDPRDPNYNQLVQAHHYAFSHEKLRMGPPLYDTLLISDQNWPNAVAGKGSALFVHRWRRPRFPTAGCIAFAAQDLDWILRHWQKDSRIFVR